MENEYKALSGLNDQDLRLNLLHWVGLRLPKAKTADVLFESEALFGYIRTGMLANHLKILPSKKPKEVEDK